jgi:hypothetical protein
VSASPDAEALIVAWLLAAMPDESVSTDVPGTLGDPDTPRAITVNALPSTGAPPAWNGPVLLHPVLVDLDFFAPTRSAAADLGRAVLEVLPGLRGHSSEHGSVAQVVPPASISWRPDYNDQVRRYGATVSLVLRPVT